MTCSSRSSGSGSPIIPMRRSPAALTTTSTTWACPTCSKSIDKVDDYTVKFTLYGAQRADPRQSRHGLRHHRVGRICRLPDEEGHARTVRPDPGRHRSVPVRRLSEGCGHPLQGLRRLLGRQGQDRRSRLCHHAGRDRALRQAQGRRMPGHDGYPNPADLEAMGKDEAINLHAAGRPQHRLSRAQRAEAALRQEGSAPGHQHGDRPRLRSSRRSIRAPARRPRT